MLDKLKIIASFLKTPIPNHIKYVTCLRTTLFKIINPQYCFHSLNSQTLYETLPSLERQNYRLVGFYMWLEILSKVWLRVETNIGVYLYLHFKNLRLKHRMRREVKCTKRSQAVRRRASLKESEISLTAVTTNIFS